MTQLLDDHLGFHIIALFVCFTHREGLARQNAINDDTAEQIVLFDVRQEEAHVACFLAQLGYDIFAVNVVDFCLAVLFQIIIQKCLQGAERNAPLRAG